MSVRRIHAIAVSLAAGMPCALRAQMLFDNGPLNTLPTGTCIPVGSSSSQLQSAGGFPNGIIGVGAQLVGTSSNRVADDFTVTSAHGWTLTSIEFVAYMAGAPSTPSPITAINFRIWNGPPSVPTSQVVFGDTTTNRLVSSTFDNSYRITSTCSTSRPHFRSTTALNVSLGPGTYWLDWQFAGNAAFTGPWVSPVTIAGLRGKPGANAVQSLDAGATWTIILDRGPSPDFSSPPVEQDLPFILNGTVNPPACYANCDGSTSIPILTANDFTCFINAYAGNNTYANCDASTGIPLLTGNDFVCFINAFGFGCS